MSATGLARSTDRQGSTAHLTAEGPASARGLTQEPAARIGKIALVAHDYTVPDCRGFYDYSEHFARINKACDDRGCDTILYALYTWHYASPVARTHDSIFDGLEHVQRVLVEVGEPPDSFDHVEVWRRGQEEPVVSRQRFAVSSASTGDKQRFLDDLPARQIADALLMLCGESNIVRLKRASKSIEDVFGFRDLLRELKTRVVLMEWSRILVQGVWKFWFFQLLRVARRQPSRPEHTVERTPLGPRTPTNCGVAARCKPASTLPTPPSPPSHC